MNHLRNFGELLGRLNACLLEGDRDKIVLVGSAPLAVRGIRDVNDLDVLCRPEVFARLCPMASVVGAEAFALGTIGAPCGVIQLTDHLPHFTGDRTGLGTSWLSADDVFAAADRRGDWLVMCMGHMLLVKRHRGFEKDRDDIELYTRWSAAQEV